MNRWIIFLATGFYSGLCPKAPGTAGSFAAMVIYCIMGAVFKEKTGVIIACVFAIGLLPAIIISDSAEKIFNEKDPQKVVIDEFFGLWITFVFVPFSFKVALIGFVLFRIFDICKPFPINYLQRIKGGLGIMIDDLLAGLYVRIIFALLLYFQGNIPFKII
ncbi:MAG: phosphatidylglycerophosphatase A [Spirochaetes bacterium]|nr:phosphatidylglycerophosphatase A [Spirochaetota bacterium]